MTKDISACNGTVGKTQSCKIKETCKRFAVHNQFQEQVKEEIRQIEFQKGTFKGLNQNQSYQKITVQMYQNGDCMFLVKIS